MLAEPVPLVIPQRPTRLMKDLHYGEGYVYAHDTEEKLTSMQCLPGLPFWGAPITAPPSRAARPGQPSGWSRSRPGSGPTPPTPQEPDKKILQISPGNSLFNICSKNFNIH